MVRGGSARRETARGSALRCACARQLLAYVMERLFAEGAADVWFEPIVMKKSRPANKARGRQASPASGNRLRRHRVRRPLDFAATAAGGGSVGL